MDIKQLNGRIAALAKRNKAVYEEVQTLGLACLAHIEEHGDVMPINRLVNALGRAQHEPFVRWALAFGKVAKNTDKATMASQPLRFAKDRQTDIVAATENPWETFADSKEDAVAKAFDFQAATMALLRRAAKAGYDHSKLVAMANVAGIPSDKVPATVSKPEAQPAA